jgi:MoaA/NifB/PqqE/SkfB family radical SAM enzyme
MLVTNAGLLKPHKVAAYADAGLSSFIISVDAASKDVHEKNRGLARQTSRSQGWACTRRHR